MTIGLYFSSCAARVAKRWMSALLSFAGTVAAMMSVCANSGSSIKVAVEGVQYNDA